MYVLIVWMGYEDIDEIVGLFAAEDDPQLVAYQQNRLDLGYGTSIEEVKPLPVSRSL